MDPTPISHEARNAIILRRTLSAVSWLYALFYGMIGVTALGRPTVGRYDLQFLLIETLLMGIAGAMLWKPRRGAVLAALAAAASSIFFVAIDLRRHSFPSALVDGAYG